MIGFLSLPVTVVPRPDEFLVGLLLRGDEANSLPAGTMATMTRRHDSGTWLYGRPSLGVLGTTFDLEAIGAYLDLPAERVEGTTFRAELRRLFGDRAAARKLGVTGAMRVCPVCVAPPGRLVRRETVLPLVHGCTRHGIWLRTACACGTPLSPYTKDRPFACGRCGLDWSELPRQPLGPRDELRQRRVVHAYRVILGRAEAGVVEAARRVLALDTGGRWDHGWCLADDAALTTLAVDPTGVQSLAGIVANLVLREIPPERLLERGGVGRHADLACRNRACPAFGTSVHIRVSAHRSNGVESYCAECGSRFLGERLILSFDRGHGSPALSPIVVGRARARLADYAMRLSAACDFLVGAGERDVHVDHVFHTAGVSTASHLRARRLGLVALVAGRLGDAMARPRGALAGAYGIEELDGRWSYPAPS